MLRIIKRNILNIDKKIEKNIEFVLGESKVKTTFHDFNLYKIVAEELQIDIYVYLAYVDGGPCGLIFCQERNKFLFKYLNSPPNGSHLIYGGPISIVGKNFVEEKLLKKISGINTYCSVVLGPKMDPIKYTRLGFELEEKKTLFIDVSFDEDMLWGNLENRIKRNIKKAYKEDITIIQDDGELFEDFYKVYMDLSKRVGLNQRDKSFYLKINNYLSSKTDNKFFYGLKDGKVISVMNILINEDMIHPWYGGTLGGFEKTGVGSLIYWEILKYAHSIDCCYYDFLGLDIPSIAFYKKGFGGEEVTFYNLKKRGLLMDLMRNIKGRIVKS